MQDQDPQASIDQQERDTIHSVVWNATVRAVRHGHVDRDWANGWLQSLGIKTLPGGSTYRINVPITGHYGHTVQAANRTEALAKFKSHVTRVAQAGQVTDGNCDGVYGIQFQDGYEPVFFSGPQDPGEDVPGERSITELRAAVVRMLKEGVAEYGWNPDYANATLTDLGLPLLPECHVQSVTVPVAGTAHISVLVFDGDSPEQVAAKAQRMAMAGHALVVQPEEVGEPAAWPPVDAMRVSLVDEGDTTEL